MTALVGVVRHVLGLAWRADRKVVGVVAALVVGQAGGVALTGLGQRWVVDATGGGTAGRLVQAALIGAAAHAVLAAGNRIRGNYAHDLTERIDLELNEEILGITTGLPTLEHLERSDYLDRVALLRRHTQALAGSCWALAETAAMLVSVGLSAWLLAAIHPALVILLTLAFPPLWSARLAQNRLRVARERTAGVQRHEEALHRMCLDPRTGQEVYLAGAGPVIGQAAATARDEVVATVFRARMGALGISLAGWLLYAAGYVLALVLVTRMAAAGEATLGDLVLLITVGSALRFEINGVVDGFSRIADAGHATLHYQWLRSFAATHGSTAGQDAPAALTHGISLRQVTFTYPGTTRPVLEDIDLELPAGSTVAVVGVNGAGKTTLTKLLTGMYAPTAGTIEVDGVPLRELSVRDWRRQATGAFQDFVQFQLPLRETVGIGRLEDLEDRDAVARAVEAAGAGEIVRRLPDGIDTQLGRVYGGTELSHGQWQRLALARSAMRPDALLVILDEPTAALDPQAEHELYDRYVDLATGSRGRITVLVSHRFSTVRAADLIVVLSDRRIAEQGSHEVLMAADGIYAQLYRTQASAYS
jgi:ATP-binding cassette subfamily B protein